MDATGQKIPASVGILTLNSAENLDRALKSVSAFSDVYICDGNSTDATHEIAQAHGARIVKQVDTDEPNQRVTDFGAARTCCLNAAQEEWYIRLDSDEYLSPEVVEELRSIIARNLPQPSIFKIPRKYVWRGVVIDDTITYPNRQIRVFRRDAVGGYTKITHEKVVVLPGQTIGLLTNPMYVPLPDSAVEFDAGRTNRALDWDRRHYEATMTLKKWLWAVLFTSATIALFTIRLIRVRLISRGNKLPFQYEWWRYEYQFRTLWLATRITFKKIFSVSTSSQQ